MVKPIVDVFVRITSAALLLGMSTNVTALGTQTQTQTRRLTFHASSSSHSRPYQFRQFRPLYASETEGQHQYSKDEFNDIGIGIDADNNTDDNTDDNTDANADADSKNLVSNRRTILKSFLPISALSFSTLSQYPDEANAAAAKAKGAAEYDFEYYMRDLVKGNNKEGNMAPSKPPPTPEPRIMSPLIRKIVNEQGDGNCIAVQELSKLTSVSTDEISDKIIAFRTKASKAFYLKEPWKEESIVDEYYFDLTCYALYRVAADLIPSNYALRDRWVRDVGRNIYKLLMSEGIVAAPSSTSSTLTSTSTSLGGKKKLTGTTSRLIQILDEFQSTNFIKGYRLGEKNDDIRTGKNIFDEYDDDDIESGLSVNLLTSIFKPATLGSSLQITGEGSRFSADVISPTLAAMFEEELGLKVEYEGYFVDEEYRPNPKDFFPNEQLLQFTLSRKK